VYNDTALQATIRLGSVIADASCWATPVIVLARVCEGGKKNREGEEARNRKEKKSIKFKIYKNNNIYKGAYL
jgi:hypothetical protein